MGGKEGEGREAGKAMDRKKNLVITSTVGPSPSHLSSKISKLIFVRRCGPPGSFHGRTEREDRAGSGPIYHSLKDTDNRIWLMGK